MQNNVIIFLNDYLEKNVVVFNETFTINELSKKVNIPIDEILCENKNIRKGDIVILPNKKYKCYVVKPADTIMLIAQKFNVSEKHIVVTNNLKQIFVGQQLLI